jgi:hypothetical protein
MPHQTKPGDPVSYSYGHTIGDYPEIGQEIAKGNKPPSLADIAKMRGQTLVGTTIVDTKDADSFINQQNQIGVSGGVNQINPNLGTLGQYIPQAQTIFDTLYSKSPEQQEREDRINTGMMMLNFFTKMGAEASRPGATALGAANVAGADTASMYIKQVNAERARRDAKKKGVVGLASQLMAKDQTTGTPKPYNVLNPDIVNRLFGTKLKQNDKISLTAKQFNQLPVGTVTDFAEPKQQKQIPIYQVSDGSVKMVVEFGEDYNRELSSGKYTTVKPAEKKAPTVYEDDFGEKRYLTGPNKDELVRDVINENKVDNNQLIEGEIENEDETVTSDNPKLKRLTKIEMKIVEGYRKEISPLTKDFRGIQAGYQKIMKFYANRDAVGDYSLAVGYAKLIDPGTAAREGEVSAIQRSGSLPDTVKAQLINAINGKGGLPERIRAGIYNRAIEIFNTERAKALDIVNNFKRLLAADLQDENQGARLDFFTIDKEADTTKMIDLSTIKDKEPFVFDEEKVKKLTVQELTTVLQQELTDSQTRYILKILKAKKKANKQGSTE